MNRRDRVTHLMQAGQAKLVAAFEALDSQAKFKTHTWERPGGGGGTARVLEGGRVFERAGVNSSAVYGDAVPPSLAKQHPGTEGKPFFATGLSLVLHPRNPYVPAFHANYRYFETPSPPSPSPSQGEGGAYAADLNRALNPSPSQGEGGVQHQSSQSEPSPSPSQGEGVWWFGGGADLTPPYPFEEDVIHFHQALKALCDRHPQADYRQLKEACDRYFFIRHRHEMRGVGGIFFDELSPVGQGDWEKDFRFVQDGIDTILPSYLPIVEKRKDAPYGERQREWQLYRRGRYVEFNLIYDRGTLFGLQTQGNSEAILMSLPPYARWEFDYRPATGSAEAAALAYYQPRDWV